MALLSRLPIPVGWYTRLRWSRGYRLALELRHPAVRRARQNERDFLAPLVPPGGLCFDIGAHEGSVTDVFLALGAARVVAAEADPVNQRTLSLRYRSDRRVTIVAAAVSDTVGTARFHVLEPGSALNTLSESWKTVLEEPWRNRERVQRRFRSTIDVATTTLDALVAEHGAPDCLKVDVEGSEYVVLSRLRVPVPLLWFEANLPEFESETISCIAHLASLKPATRFNYTRRALYDPGVCFALPEWTSAERMIQEVEARGTRFMEVFATTESVHR